MRMFERHYQEFHQHILDLEGAEPVFVDITPAATWFYEESDQEIWDVENDFPTVLSPWPVTWYEFKYPRFSLSEIYGKVISPKAVRHVGFWVTRSLELTKDQSQAFVISGAWHRILHSWIEMHGKPHTPQLKLLKEEGERREKEYLLRAKSKKDTHVK